MSERIDVTLPTATYAVAAGESVEAMATLRNTGQTVDQFTLSIEGLEPDWYTLPVSSMALFPNDRDDIKIVLHPPKTGKAMADSYPFQVKVTSQESPDDTATVDVTLETRRAPELELSISPERVSGRRGTYRVVARNPGDVTAELHLEVDEISGSLRYSLSPDVLTVGGGGQSQATLEVGLGWLALLGGQREFDIQVMAVLADTDETKTINGKFIRIPWYRTLPQIRLPRIPRLPQWRIPWLTRPPEIGAFRAVTDDRHEFKLSWITKRASQVKLNGEVVDSQGDKTVRPTELTSYTLDVSNRYGSTSRVVDVQPIQIPSARVSERIRVSMTPTELQVSAGGVPAPVTVQIQNLGDIVDKFVMEIEGLNESWYSRSASSIALMPQATDQMQVSFQPPKRKGAKAGKYPFALTVRSQSVAEDATSIIGQMEILPSTEFKLTVRPYRISSRRKGTYRVNLENTGVSDTRLILSATDLDEGLNFRFKQDDPVVTAWNSVEVPVLAKPRRGSMIGERKRYDITVTARTAEGSTQTANCELYHNPFMASWKPIWRVVRAVLVLGALGVLIGFVLHWGGGWRMLTSNPETWWNNLVRVVTGWFSR